MHRPTIVWMTKTHVDRGRYVESGAAGTVREGSLGRTARVRLVVLGSRFLRNIPHMVRIHDTKTSAEDLLLPLWPLLHGLGCHFQIIDEGFSIRHVFRSEHSLLAHGIPPRVSR